MSEPANGSIQDSHGLIPYVLRLTRTEDTETEAAKGKYFATSYVDGGLREVFSSADELDKFQGDLS